MKKGRAITLISIISVLLAVVLVLTFVRFPVGINDYNSAIGAIDQDYDYEGGSTYKLTLAKDNDKEVEDINEVVNTLKTRLDELGYISYSVTALKPVKEVVEEKNIDYEIRIDTKKTSSIASDISVIAAYGTVELYGGTSANPTDKIFEDEKTIEDSRYVGETLGQDGTTVYQVSIKFTDSCYTKLVELIKNAEAEEGGAYYLAIKFGDQTLMSGENQISTDYFNKKILYLTSSSETSAKQLALQIRTGGLDYKYDVSTDTSAISPLLGDNAGLYSIIAVYGFVALAIIMFFVKFKGFGFVAAFSLIIFVLAQTWLLVAFPGITVSVSGLIATVLATLLVIDGLFIIAKRVSEEALNGKTLKASVKTGYSRSLFPILNSNVIVLLTSAMLLAFVSGPFRCFALSLTIGVILSFIVTMVISRAFTWMFVPLLKTPKKAFNVKVTEEA